MSDKPAKTNQEPPVVTPSSLDPIDPGKLKERRDAVVNAMENVMEEGVHFGSVGNVDRSVLLKPGAEMLCNLFNLGAEPEEIRIESMPNVGPPNGPEHREYHADIRIFHIPTGQKVGIGTASCSTAETKYRFRWEYYDVSPPNEYWESGDNGNSRDESILWDAIGESPQIEPKVPGFTEIEPHKNGSWVIRVRRENWKLADQYNTVKKMAKKRGLIDAVLTALGVSALFTQDVEEPHIGPQERSGGGQGEGQGKSQSGQRGAQGGAQRSNRPPARPQAQETAPANVEGGPEPENGFVQREEDEGRFQRSGPESQKRLRKMDLYLLRSSRDALPERFQVVQGAISNGETPTAAYARHLIYLHKQRLDPVESPEQGYPNDAQISLLFGRGTDHGWTNKGINRLVKQGWGFDSMEKIPSREVFDEILLQLEDEKLASVFNRDPNTKDAFRGESVDPARVEDESQIDEAAQEGQDDGNGQPERGAPSEPGGGLEAPDNVPEGGVNTTPVPDELPHVEKIREAGIERLVTLQERIRDGSVLEVDGIGDKRAQEISDFLGVELGFETHEGEGDPGEEDWDSEPFPPPEEDPNVPQGMK